MKPRCNPQLRRSKSSKAHPKKQTDEIAVSPAARRALREHGLHAADIEASGPTLRTEDVLRHVDDRKKTKPNVRQESRADRQLAAKPRTARAAAPACQRRPRRSRPDEPDPPPHRRAARQAQQQAALLTTFNEIDMTAVKELRAEYQDVVPGQVRRQARLHVVLRQSRRRCPQSQPALNAEIRDNKIVYRHYYHIGIAVSSTKGLVVPVLRYAERLSFAEIEQAIADFGKRASSNKLDPTTSKAAPSRSPTAASSARCSRRRSSTRPKAASSACTPFRTAPSPANGQVVIRPMMYVALTYDHRIVDGREAVTFLVRIKEALEDPTRMLLEV